MKKAMCLVSSARHGGNSVGMSVVNIFSSVLTGNI